MLRHAIKQTVLFVSLLLCGLGCAAGLSESQATDKVHALLQTDPAYAWTQKIQLLYETEISGDFIFVTLREKNPSDPQLTPLVDRFRLNRRTGALDWMNTASEWIAYKKGIRNSRP
jgi:hypothetical protein